MRGESAVNNVSVGHDLNVNALESRTVLFNFCDEHIADILGESIRVADSEAVQEHLIANRRDFQAVPERIAGVDLKHLDHRVVAVLRRGVGVEVQVVLTFHDLDFFFAVGFIDESARSVNDYRQVVLPLGVVRFKKPDE